MKRYAFINDLGEVAYTATTVVDDMYTDGDILDGHLVKEVDLAINEVDLTTRIFWSRTTKTWEVRPIKPSDFHVWSGSEWVGDLAALRESKLAEARRHTRMIQRQAVDYAGSSFDNDPGGVASLQSRLYQVSQGRELPAGFTWRTTDNQQVPADAEFLSGLLLAIENYNYSVLLKSWAAKSSIQQALDFDQLADLDVVTLF